VRNPIAVASRFRVAAEARRQAEALGLVGKSFGDFGRRLGGRLILRRPRLGCRYLLTPVNHIRYFEFDAAYACLRDSVGTCLDVSSPRLFGLYVAARHPDATITFVNPDARDVDETRAAIGALKLRNCRAKVAAVDDIRNSDELFDCVWSISVIEHIAGEYDDRQAIRWLFRSVRPGGRLFITVPVDRTHWDEYRDKDPYGTQKGNLVGGYFFQRFYNRASLESRLVETVGCEPLIQWFGEKTPGRFKKYMDRWQAEGSCVTDQDPLEIAAQYRHFPSWEEMPGIGVAALLFEKPHAPATLSR
jgi:SAM-dependent methyltransferase